MKSGLIRTGRAVACVGIVAGLVAGCGGKSNDASSSTSPKPTGVASQIAGLTGVSADCKELIQLFQDSSTAIGSTKAATMQQASDQTAKAAASMSDPKLKDAAMKISQYLAQEAAYAKDPSAKSPDSSLVNAASDAMGGCATHQ